ncbi:MAG: DUF58 domain-containing protein [Desulfurococcales archaeon]|nr:DUF58 domain-containing protein [Desulfurococcales archaeon]
MGPIDPCKAYKLGLSLGRIHASSLSYGINRLRVKGIGLEYVDFREYQEGDDLKHVDWKVSARLPDPGQGYRLIVKEYEEERMHRAVIAVDLSLSMSFREKPWALGYSLTLIASTAYTLGDRAVLATLSSSGVEYRHSRPESIPFMVKRFVCEKGFSGSSSREDLLQIMRLVKRRDTVVLFTDYDNEPGAFLELSRGVTLRDGFLYVVAVLDPAEVGIEASGIAAMSPLESEGLVLGSLEKIYEGIRAHVNRVNAALAASPASAVLVNSKWAPGARWHIIRGYIGSRAREPYKWGL